MYYVKRHANVIRTASSLEDGVPGIGLGGGEPSSSSHTRYNPVRDDLSKGSIVEEMIPPDPRGRARLDRLIYQRDGVGGPGVDIIMELLHSDFNLTNVKDPKILQTYEDAKDSGGLLAKFPQIVGEYLKIGRVAVSHLFDGQKGYWRDIHIQPAEHLEVEAIPIGGFDPKVNLKPEVDLAKFIRSKDPRDIRARAGLAPETVRLILSGKSIPLNPDNTAYLVRQAYPNDPIGLSLYSRMYALLAIEKALTNGTIAAVRRWLGPRLHIKAGLPDVWDPNERELQNLVNLMMAAEEDPVASITATRLGVDVTEIGGGRSNFWALDDSWEMLQLGKMRAIGMHENLLDGQSCLIADTLVATDRGLLRIGHIRDKANGRWQDLDLSVASRFGKGRTSKWFFNGVRPTYHVVSALGHRWQATGNHPFLVLADDETDWKRVDRLAPGDFLCLPTKPVLREDRLAISFPAVADVRHGGRLKAGIKAPVEMTPALAFLIGLLVSEGTVSRRTRSIRFPNTEAALIAAVKASLSEIFGLEASVRVVFDPEAPKPCHVRAAARAKEDRKNAASTRKSWELIACSKAVVEWLAHLGLYVDGNQGAVRASRFKRVPWSILQADGESQLAFLAGFIEGDGSVSQRGIGFHSASSGLLADLQALLGAHGFALDVKVGRGTLPPSPSARLWRGLTPYILVKSFPKTVQEGGDRMRLGIPLGAWKAFLARRRQDETNLKGGVQYLTDDGRRVRRPLPFKTCNWLLYDRLDAGWYKEDLETLRVVSPERFARLERLIECRYQFVPVESVSFAGDAEVFDLTMAGGEEPAFVANGVLVHNTFNNMDHARSMFMERVRSLRQHFKDEYIIGKFFRVLARVHGFYKIKRADLDHRVRTTDPSEAQLDLPEVEWVKQLTPENDLERLDVLKVAEDKGVLIPVRVWAAACGVDYDKTMTMRKGDLEDRKQIAEWRRNVSTLGEPTGDVVDGDNPDDKDLPAMQDIPTIHARVKELPVWRENQFLGLSLAEALSLAEEVVRGRAQRNGSLSRALLARSWTPGKRELAGYVLGRARLAAPMIMSEETFQDITGWLTRGGNDMSLDALRELQHAVKCVRRREEVEAVAQAIKGIIPSLRDSRVDPARVLVGATA